MKTYPKEKVVDRFKVKAVDGCFLKPEKWEFARVLKPSYWADASHYLQRGWGEHEGEIAVNVYITGRTIKYDKNATPYIAVLIEFVGDGEPSTYSKGTLELNSESMKLM